MEHHLLSDDIPAEAPGFGDLLDLLSIDETDRISVCLQVAKAVRGERGTFTSSILARPKAVELATGFGAIASNRADVWFGVNPVDPPADYRGRGTAEHVTRLAALVVDLDVGAGKLADDAMAGRVATGIGEALGTPYSAVVDSGHGYHAYWPTDPDDDLFDLGAGDHRADAVVLLRRFGRLAKDIARREGGEIDSVFDLPRVLRVPGTFNFKNPADPKPVVLHRGSGAPLTWIEIDEALDAYGAGELPEDRPGAATGERVSDPDTWTYSATTHHYVAAMISGWSADVESGSITGRHPWLVGQATRLEAARRCGRIAEADYDRARVQLAEHFARLCARPGDKRKVKVGEVDSAFGWATARVAAKSDEDVLAEVGGPDGVLTVLDGPAGGSGDVPLDPADPVYLPAEWWDRRAYLRHIRDAAWARDESPAGVLLAALAIVSAHIDPAVRVDTGIRSPVPLSMYVALMTRSGIGKTSAWKCARALLDIAMPDPFDPDLIAPAEVPTRHGFGSGQGVAEAYMGVREVESADGSVSRERAQVLHKLMLVSDEGAELLTQIEGASSILGPVLRSAWSGEIMGQANASKERMRDVEDCVLGIVVGMHRSTCGELSSPTYLEIGMPQRFLFCALADPYAPDLDAAPGHPGPLRVVLTGLHGVTLCPELRHAIRVESLARRRGKVVPPAESQSPAMLARLSGLLAILDGRDVVEVDDWGLAEVLYACSLAVQADAIAWLAEERSREHDARVAAQRAAAVATASAVDRRADTMTEVGTRLLAMLPADGTPIRWSGRDGIRKLKFRGEHRPIADEALDHLVEVGRVSYVDGSVALIGAAA